MYTYTNPYASYGEGVWSEASYAYNHGSGGNPYYYPNSYDYYCQEAYGGEQFSFQGHQYYAQEASYPGQHQYYQDQQCFIQTVSCDNTANGQVVRSEVHYVYYFNHQYGTYVFSHTYQTNTVLEKNEKDVPPRIVEVDVSKDEGYTKDPIAACMDSKTKRPDLLHLEWRQEENPSFNKELDSSEPSQDKVTGASVEVNAVLEKLKEHPSLESVQIFASAIELDDEKDGESSIQEVADIASDNASKMKSLMMNPSLESVQIFSKLEPSDNADSTLQDVVDDFEQTVENPMFESTDVKISTIVEFDSDSNSGLNPEEHTVVSQPIEEEQSVESCEPTGWRKCLRKLTVFASAACKEIASCYIKGMLL